MLLRYVFLACLTLSSGELLSQRYPFINYTPIDGLVNNRVRSMFQDSKGRLYFLTAGGLSQYDGARFTNYTPADGLAQEVVNDMLEITPDSFWVASNINKLNALAKGKISEVKTIDGFYPIINSFHRTMDGTIYVAGDDGLFVWQKNRFVRLPFPDEAGDNWKYFTMIKEAGRFLLLLVNPGLSLEAGTVYLYDPVTHRTIYKHNSAKTYQWTTSPEGDIWIAGPKGLRVLKKQDLEQGIYSEQPIPESFSSVRNELSYFIRFDKIGRLWMSIPNEGLLLVQAGKAPIKYTEASGLASGRISYFFQDKEENNWFAAEGRGVQKLVATNIELLDHPFGFAAVSDISVRRGSDSIWLSLEPTRQLVLLVGATKKVFDVARPLPNGAFVASSGSTVFLYDGQSVYKYEVPKTGSSLRLICQYHYSQVGLSYGNLDPNGNLVYCGGNMLRVYFKDCSIFLEPLHYFADGICFDKKGMLWVVTRSRKLLAFSLHPENPLHYLELKYDLSSQLNLDNPRSLVVDENNRIWIGTRFDGLYGYNFDGTRLKLLHHITRKNGLTDNFINYLEYHNDNLWASSPAGLDKLRIINQQPIIENITESNKIYVSIKKVIPDKNGTIWAVGESGNLVKIDAPLRKTVVDTPKLFLSYIKVGQEAISDLTSVKPFHYTHNNISFFAAAPSYYDEKQIHYSYLLEGSGNLQWSEPAGDASFHFVNLAPGNYVLRVKAEFPAGRYPPQLVNYPFVVNPPWWQTWWFRVLLGFMAIGFSIAIVRWYYRAKFLKQKIILEKKQAVEKERTRIATDMHDDLGAGLSRIKFLSESIQFKKSGEESILGEVQKIAAYSDEMVEKMGEIVWALNEKNDTLEHLVAFTRSYAADYLSTNQIQCVFKSSDELPSYFVTGEIRRNIFLSVKESLHNIVKHAGARTVTIKVAIDSHLTVSIHDDGRGIDWDHIRPFSNGLSNIQKRMEEIGGKAAFHNSEGTEVILDVPLRE